MKVLVFGASGQVAKSLANLSTADVEIVTLGRPDGDITSEAAIRMAIVAHEPDVVVNAAAYTAVDAAEDDAENAFLVNETGPGHLASVTHETGIPFIHYSTDYVFGGDKDGSYLPTDPVAPIGVYGKSKEAGEAAVRKNNPKHVILRTAWVFSPFGKNFVKTMLNLGKSRDELTVVADQFGSPTYAPDIAEATLAIARNILASPADSSLYGTFHLTNSGDTNWAGFAAEIFRQAEPRFGITCSVKPIPSSEFPTKAERPANSRLDGTHLDATHGLVRRHWKEALEECLSVLTVDPE